MSASAAGTGCIEILAARQTAAHAALHALAADNSLLGAARPEQLLVAPNLVSFLIRAGFLVTLDGDDIDGLEFYPDPLGDQHGCAGPLDQEALLSALARFVSPGGQMEFCDEGDGEWHHLFDGASMTTVTVSGAPT